MKQNSHSELDLQLKQITLKKLKISKIYFQTTKNTPIVYTNQYNEVIKKLLKLKHTHMTQHTTTLKCTIFVK